MESSTTPLPFFFFPPPPAPLASPPPPNCGPSPKPGVPGSEFDALPPALPFAPPRPLEIDAPSGGPQLSDAAGLTGPPDAGPFFASRAFFCAASAAAPELDGSEGNAERGSRAAEDEDEPAPFETCTLTGTTGLEAAVELEPAPLAFPLPPPVPHEEPPLRATIPVLTLAEAAAACLAEPGTFTEPKLAGGAARIPNAGKLFAFLAKPAREPAEDAARPYRPGPEPEEEPVAARSTFSQTRLDEAAAVFLMERIWVRASWSLSEPEGVAEVEG